MAMNCEPIDSPQERNLPDITFRGWSRSRFIPLDQGRSGTNNHELRMPVRYAARVGQLRRLQVRPSLSICARVAGQHGGRRGAGVGRNHSMSMQDLPVGRRRDDQTDLVQPASISSAPPWDSVLDRLTNLERSHADLARLVTSIHEALPPEIAAATGRGLALGSPIDAVSPTTSFGVAPPIHATPPPPLPKRVEPPGSPNIDPFAQTFEAPDPWAAPVVGGEAFLQPLESPGMALAQAPSRPRRRMLRGRRAAKEAQARIAAEFAAPPPPPGFYSHDPAALAPPPPPPGSGADGPAPDFGLPTGWGTLDVPPPAPAGFASQEMWSAPHPPPGFATDSPNAGFAAPPGWFGSAAEGPPPPPIGFASDLAEPAVVEPPEPDPSSWGAGDLSSPSDFVFDEPVVPPPPGFGPSGYEGLS